MNSNKTRLLRSFIIQSVGFACLSASTLLGLFFLEVKQSLVLGLIVIVIDFLFLFLVGKKKPYAIAGSVGMFATGLVIGGFLSDYGLLADRVLYAFLITIAFLFLLHGLLLLVRLNRLVLAILVFILFVATIVLYSNFNNPLFKMLAFLSTNLFCIEIGLLISVGKSKPVDRYLAGGMLWAFAVVFVVVLIVVSEGEILGGIDGLDFSPGSRKKKKR